MQWPSRLHILIHIYKTDKTEDTQNFYRETVSNEQPKNSEIRLCGIKHHRNKRCFLAISLLLFVTHCLELGGEGAVEETGQSTSSGCLAEGAGRASGRFWKKRSLGEGNV